MAQHRYDSKGNAVLEKGFKPNASTPMTGRTTDLREFIARAERADEIARIKGADWNLEIGTLAEIVYHAPPEPPAMLFEDVPGYPKGMRLLSGATNSSKRLAITLGFPVPSQSARRGARLSRPHEEPPADPAEDRGDRGRSSRTSTATTRSTCLKFPVPFLHEHDGGRYIGTDDS